ncbi:MAG: ABC transporter permease [Planctomycetota bacterium]|nr:MAG: ABC transporter permease [Planctomycetota bacterium]
MASRIFVAPIRDRILSPIGSYVGRSVHSAGYTMLMTCEAIIKIPTLLNWRNFCEFLRQCYLAGIQSLPVVFLVGLFVGMILSLQSGLTLMQFGLERFIAEITGAALTREMGPLMTAIILTGRVGSSMAAELGTMSVSEEIDALRIMSINPVRFLVLPRILATVIMMVVLTVFAILIGIFGGALIGQAQIGVSYDMFFKGAFDVITYKDLYSGLTKAAVFGLLISMISCSEGLRTTGGAEGVGRGTRRAVVNCLLYIIMFNYIMDSFIFLFVYGR